MKGRIMLFLLAWGILNAPLGAQDNSIKLIQTKYSKKAVRLVLKNMGKKVGSGTSLALLDVYEKKTRSRNAIKFSLSKKYLPYVAVGDELYFSGTYKNVNPANPAESTTEYAGPMHYAIVVGKKDDNTLLIAHQNLKEGDPRKAYVMVTGLKVEDIDRYENINVYGLWPKKKDVKPEKILVKDGPVYEITADDHGKKQYFANANYTR